MTQQEAVVAVARAQIGKQYQWGGEDNPGFDCSGLCEWSYAQIGVAIPRTSQAQAVGGIPIAYSDLQLGDLIIYYPDATHVALYSGNGNVIEAPTTGEFVKEVSVDSAGPYNCARRYLTEEEAVTPLYYPDVSNLQWDSDQDAIDFLTQLKPEGFSGVVHKVSEGDYFQDEYWPTVRQWCEANDLPWLGYHYVTTDNPSAQAATWVSNNGGPFAMMDFEANSGDLTNFWAVVNAFNSAGVDVSLAYIPQWYWEEIGSPDLSVLASNGISLVSSAYPAGAGYASTIYTEAGGSTGEGWDPYGGGVPVAWQFTDEANIDGWIVDCNAYIGTSLNNLFTGTA